MEKNAPARPRDAAHLARMYAEKRPDGHFFDQKTLKFFGERLSEMRLLKGTVEIESAGGYAHECYVISTVQRPGPPLKPRRVYHYFDVETLENVCT